MKSRKLTHDVPFPIFSPFTSCDVISLTLFAIISTTTAFVSSNTLYHRSHQWVVTDPGAPVPSNALVAGRDNGLCDGTVCGKNIYVVSATSSDGVK